MVRLIFPKLCVRLWWLGLPALAGCWAAVLPVVAADAGMSLRPKFPATARAPQRRSSLR